MPSFPAMVSDSTTKVLLDVHLHVPYPFDTLTPQFFEILPPLLSVPNLISYMLLFAMSTHLP